MKIQTPGSSHTVTNAAHVALFIAPGKDYHWYRQNPNRTWSHKTQFVSVSCLDAAGDDIWDPQAANHNYNDDRTTYYNEFVCYLAITPLNILIN